jgi:signal transduction histidine kinase
MSAFDQTQHTVLVVDDEPGMRETVADLLEHNGIKAVAVANAAAAEEAARAHRVALALIDQRLPDSTGIELAATLKERDPNLPIVMLTGYASLETAMAAVGLIDDFLVKPAQPEHLLKVVRDGIERRWLRLHNEELVAQLQQANLVLEDNVRRRQNELAALIAMTEAISSSTRLVSVLDSAVDALAHLPGTRTAGLYLVTEGGEMVLRAVRGRGWIPPQKLPTIHDSVRQLTLDGDHECVVAALTMAGTVMGALLLERSQQEADAFLVALATQVAVGIENAQRSERERATAERMVELNRMKSSFIANVSHELRTPLTAVIGFARTLQSRGGGISPEEQRRLIERIENQARRLQRLVEDLLDEASLERGAMRVSQGPVQPMDVVGHVVGALHEPVHVIEVQMPVDAPYVIADGGRLEQVLSNLIENATKYSPVGTQITIGGDLTSRGFELYVADEGIGIAPEFLPRLFEPFTQADTGDTRRDSGVGLGLSICKGLVEAMGGSLEVDSTPGVGTRFTVVLPRVVPSPPVGSAAAKPSLDLPHARTAP